MRRVALIACTVALTGCQAMMYGTASDLNAVQIGMTKAEVVAKLGPPVTSAADAAKNEERLTYQKMARTLGWWPGYYDVLLKDGRVVQYGAQP